MDPGLYSSITAMNVAEKQMEAITANLANVGTTAYKRHTVSVGSFGDTLQSKAYPGSRPVGRVDFSQGMLEETGDTYHVALQGRGFFAVDTPWGEGYTRNGRFQLSNQGELVTQEGFRVAWEGAPGRIDADGQLPIIDPSGVVWQGDSRVGQLRLQDFSRPARLEAGRFAYLYAAPNARARAAEGSVVQGSLERSNTSALDELIAMVNVQRRFESAGRMMSLIEQSYRRLSNNT